MPLLQEEVHDMENLWIINEKDFDLSKNKHYEGAFTQGSGYLSVRGSFEEGLQCAVQDEEYIRMPANVTLEKQRSPISKWGTFIPGIVGNHPVLKEEIINLPWFLEFMIFFDGEKLDMANSCIKEYNRYLDMKDGVLYRSFIWNTKSGSKLKLSYKRFISLYERNLCVQEIDAEVISGDGKLEFESGINANVRTNGYNHFRSNNSRIENGKYILMETVVDTGRSIAEACAFHIPESCSYNFANESDRIYVKGSTNVNGGNKLHFIKLSAICTSFDMEKKDPKNRVVLCLKKLENIPIETIYKRHEKIWNDKWNKSDIKIKGDDYSQIALRFSMYHLMRSNSEFDPRVAICAKGYAGEAYFGHYFWDTEIYLLPFYILTNPNAAKNLILFRYNTLKGARANARRYGYKGARYPWESSVTGDEECSNWQYADNEIHVTADVAYGLWHYYKATMDYNFLKDFAFEILIETSRYWMERTNRKNNKADISGVMGPDEYTAFSRNNAYTNRMVKFNLETAVNAAEIIKQNNEADYKKEAERLNLTEKELYEFKETAKALKIPECDGLVLQSEDFMNFEDIDFNKVWINREKPFGHFVSQERMYRSKCLKQADVLAMMLLFPDDFTIDEINRAFDYYEPITTHDSSLSYVVHSIISNLTGKSDLAEKFFKKAVDIDLNPAKGGAAEGIHIANCGGLYQAVIYGFAGLKDVMWSDELKLKPHLPDKWESLEFNIIWKKELYHVQIKKGDEYKVEKIREDIIYD